MDISPIAPSAAPHGDFGLSEVELPATSVDHYVDSPPSVTNDILSGFMNGEATTSLAYRSATAALQSSLEHLDSSPVESMQSMLELQMRVGEAQLKVEFATSLAQSVNHGFSTLFQLQN